MEEGPTDSTEDPFVRSGRVADAETGAPIANALIELPLLDLRRTADALGRVDLGRLPGGTHRITVRRSGYQEIGGELPVPWDSEFVFFMYPALGTPAGQVGEGGTGAPLVQPGAPGDPSRVVSPQDVARAEGPRVSMADVRFMQRMVPHHAQALEMTALAAERAGSSAVRAMALRMQISQRDEIALIDQWLRARGERAASPDGSSHANGHAMGLMPGMLTPEQMGALASGRGSQFDRLFLELMIQHHEGAITMVEELFGSPGAGQVSEIFQFASEVESDQRMEIDRMRRLLEESER
jgi:uncharacterized protein (DUF305 family)